MKKKKSIIGLSVTVAIIIVVTVFTFIPTFPIGIYDYTSPVNLIKLGLDLKGGVYVTFRADEDAYTGDDFDSAIAGTAVIMQDRLAAKGYTEAVVTVVDRTNIRVEIPDIDDPDDVFNILSKPAKLEIRLLAEDGELVTDSSNIVSAQAYYDSSTSSWAVMLTMNTKGANDISAKTTGLNYGTDMIYFILDGSVLSSPTVSGHITGKTSSITHIADAETAQSLAIQISSGAFEIEFTDEPIEIRAISARLGEEAISTTFIAAIVIIALIAVLLVALYGLFGVASSIALICYTVLVVLALAFLPFAQLTLPGVAGIILGIGMAVDSFVLILERVKDEFRAGKSLIASVESGFSKTLGTILDSNITTLIGAIALWIFASGPVQGFAITLVFSIVASLISSLLITRLLIKLILPLQPNNPKLYRLLPAAGVK